MNISQDATPIPDDFPDENLFSISTLTPWYVDVANYLVLRNLPQNLIAREKHNIIQLSTNYSWIERYFYLTRPDLIMRRCVREDHMYDVLKSC